jgi:glycosyltransferase involved in cell wall biosynthesis
VVELTVERTGRLAFVPGRYGPGVVGGAEAMLAEIAHGLGGRGWEVEILTTCARDHFSWTNEFPPGATREGEVTVRRFPAVVSTSRRERAALNAAIVARQPLGIDEQVRWMNDDLRVPALFDHILGARDDYRALVFAPYLFWPAFAGAQLAGDRSILVPCLHDEPEAHLEIFPSLFGAVRGLWFLSEPERDLAARLFPGMAEHEVVGSGVDIPDRYDPDGFRARHGIEGRFVLYVGRRERGKNWDALLGAFGRAVARNPDLPFSLVTIGSSDITVPDALADRVVDLGVVTDQVRNDAFAAADAYLQPSAYESFSRTMMEAWLAETVVVANGAAEVSRWHCERSGAGLVYDDDAEFQECLRFVAEAPDAARGIAKAGRDYALETASWDAVLDAIEASLDAWVPGRES